MWISIASSTLHGLPAECLRPSPGITLFVSYMHFRELPERFERTNISIVTSPKMEIKHLVENN